MKRLLPAYPIFNKDPFFSIWSKSERLNDANLMTWYCDELNIYGFIFINGIPYCFMGDCADTQKINQTSIDVTAYTTDYIFENEFVKLKVKFVSPLCIENLKLLSTPVCYVSYVIEKKVECKTEFAIAVNGNICFNADNDKLEKCLRGESFNLGEYSVAWFGLMQQAPLSHSLDRGCADWGYYYLSGEKVDFTDKPFDFKLANDKCEQYLVSKNSSTTGNVMFAFDDIVSINYFGDYLKGYYFSDGATVIDALNETYYNIEKIDAELKKSNDNIVKMAEQYGEEYKYLLFASLRQSVNAHKLVKDCKGNILFLSKECNSNGCIATVDVSYPSIPLYLLFNTELVKGMMRPIFKFANYPVWQYDFAPHDAGTYPCCTGQVYGLREDNKYHKTGAYQTHADFYKFPASVNAYKFESQMPVEESANMIIMAYACYYRDNDESFLRENYETLEKWVEYLVKYGLKPENQLCTDDFDVHLHNNVNLAIQATVAIKCFERICTVLGKESARFESVSKHFALEIEKFGEKYKHLPLTWDSDDGTFSLKYNLAFDKILNLNLFSRELYQKEVTCYLEKMNKYGTPLDNRADYTKSDWILWATVLADDIQTRKQLFSGVSEFLVSSPDRVPFSDWYNTSDGKHNHFKNRTVQGGIFILLLADLH